MKGSPMHVGTTEHKSALKQKSSWDETEVKKGTDDKRGNATTTTERIKGKANDKKGHRNKTYGATDVEGYQDSETARDTYGVKEKANKKRYKTKAVYYSKDDKGTIIELLTK